MLAPSRFGPRQVVAGFFAALSTGCVFTPPPPLPEEVAAREAEAQARAARLEAPSAADPESLEEEGGAQAARRFEEGAEPEIGMTAEEMKAYAQAQGDPEAGDFTLEEALAGLPEDGSLWVRLVTDKGTIECEMYEDQAPLTVANFVGLARGVRPSRDERSGEWAERRYFDGTVIHRAIPGFVIQGGDPTGTGRGNAGYVIPDEFVPELRHEEAGILSMANRGAGTGSSQFFVTLAPTPHLDDKHTVFGQCTEEGVQIAESIAATAGAQDRPDPPVQIQRVEVLRVSSEGQVLASDVGAAKPASQSEPKAGAEAAEPSAPSKPPADDAAAGDDAAPGETPADDAAAGDEAAPSETPADDDATSSDASEQAESE